MLYYIIPCYIISSEISLHYMASYHTIFFNVKIHGPTIDSVYNEQSRLINQRYDEKMCQLSIDQNSVNWCLEYEVCNMHKE